MQIPPPAGEEARIHRPGDVVLVRRARWRVVEIRPYVGCELVTLAGLTPPHLGAERRVLLPFDTIEALNRPRRPRAVRSVTWRRACRGLIAAESPPGSLRTALTARIDLLPHQLEPAIAVARGLGMRLLLADAVGLGKTIQAGLVMAELLSRGSIHRILVLTPPGLRDQWVQELVNRFAIEAVAIDGPVLRRIGSTLPLGVHPWRTLSTIVASIDYIKRPEVFPAAASCRWDLVAVDEAHGCASESDRREAAHALAERAPYVLLLSATPHSGDRDAFDALCRMGKGRTGGAPLLVFRRTRADAGVGTARRIHILRVAPNRAEQVMHATLARYTAAIRRERGVMDAWLALSVLHKRALSSAWSLARSLQHRLDALAVGRPAPEQQIGLPLGDPQGELIVDDEAPAWPPDLGLSDSVRERRLLSALSNAAKSAAAGGESKILALVRLLRRTAEPAVVFTEFRDTLLHMRQQLARPSLVLHGGLGRAERSSTLASFADDPRGLLLATDAAAEGLNLHHHCRLVINLELPWNPMRLEQRIGRVDRIGQRRRVHAFHLVAAHTGEARLLARLKDRIASAQADIGAPDPLEDDRHAIARLVIGPGDIRR